MKKLLVLLIIVFGYQAAIAQAQYNAAKGQNIIYKEVADKQGKRKKVKVAADKYGNASGKQYDLAVDGAFKGTTVAVLHLYTGEGFDFSLPKAALKKKGFSVYRWINNPPSPKELEKSLKKACQLWVISGPSQKLNAEHLKVIKNFFDSGKGVYIWGDNAPYYADANYVAQALLGVGMQGNVQGNQNVGLQTRSKKVGLLPGHLVTTGLTYVYEGITIATIKGDLSEKANTKNSNNQKASKDAFQPLIYGSAGNLVAVSYENKGKRAILDGGFTRLFLKWDTAGTGRYVKNAAAWLVNIERFGNRVYGRK